MKLYYTKRSPYARKVRVVALEKNISLDLIEEDLNSKSSDLILCNPLGKIPTLVLDGGRVLADSTIICEYLDTLNTTPQLIKENVKEEIVHLDSLAKGMIDAAVAAFYEILKHPKDFNLQYLDKQKETLKRCLNYFEQHAAFLKDLNMASISLACAIGYIQFRLPDVWSQNTCPKLVQWFDQISSHISMVKTVPSI